MARRDCQEWQQLIQADLDNELTAAEAARVAAHIETCAECAATRAALSSLSAEIRRDAPRYAASPLLREAVCARIAPNLSSDGRSLTRPTGWPGLARTRLGNGVSFGMGFALAVCVALVVILPQNPDVAEAVITDHIRSLQPGHLMDVVSTDQHTVKPWFDGRLAFAPPVKDLRADGFPLAGGRLDYLDGRDVAALIYRNRQHTIELFIWPNDSQVDFRPMAGSRSGYNFMHWSSDGMTFWVVSDLDASGLSEFVRLWRSH
jgi:anti-sigma factor RsiW